MFKPMLAGKAPADLTTLRYPVLASPKLDGVRCVMRDGVAMSRNLKPIPNQHVQETLRGLPDGIDGELMVDGDFAAVQSAVMSATGRPVFWLFAFDWHANLIGFQDRLSSLAIWSETRGNSALRVVEHVLIEDAEQLAEYEEQTVARGFEGIMVRDPDGPYKFGRSTTREGYLLKIKRTEDEEATVIDVVERMHNANAREQDAFGRTKRSSAKDGMVPAGDLGALVVVTNDSAEFQIGSGFTAEQRVEFWNTPIIGRTVTFTHQPPPGGRPAGQAPRFPVFKGWRRD